MSERLDEIEAILRNTAEIAQQNAQAIAKNTQAIADASQSREELRRSFNGMQQALTAMASTQIEILQRIDATQAEIRGMQVENRRILDHLFGEA